MLTPQQGLFALFFLASIASALGVVMLRNPIKSALSLVACFFSLACIYVLQRAELLALLEVLVYAGAIMVLFVFVIMLVADKDEPAIAPNLGQQLAVPIKVLAVALVVVVIGFVIAKGSLGEAEALPVGFGSVRTIGRAFLVDHLFQFELTSLLLLVGIVGAVILAKRAKE